MAMIVKVALANGSLEQRAIAAFKWYFGFVPNFENRKPETTQVFKSVEFLIFRIPPQNIPWLVSTGRVDFGIGGSDIVKSQKKRYPVKALLMLPVAKNSNQPARVCLMRRKGRKLFKGEKIRFAYPPEYRGLVNEFLATIKQVERGVNLRRFEVERVENFHRTVEVSLALGLADYIFDVEDTGRTRRACKLKLVRTITDSHLVLMSRRRPRKGLLNLPLFRGM